IRFCMHAFNEICNPTCPIYGDKLPASQSIILLEAKKWLLKFYNKGLFVGYVKAYYSLVDKLMDTFPPSSLVDAIQVLLDKNIAILYLIKAAEGSSQLHKDLAYEKLKKWLFLLEKGGIQGDIKRSIILTFKSSLLDGTFNELKKTCPFL